MYKMCRICMGYGGVVSVYKDKQPQAFVSLKTMMETIFSFKMEENDGLPCKLCKRCSSKVTASYKLKYIAEESNKKLLKCIEIGYVIVNDTITERESEALMTIKKEETVEDTQIKSEEATDHNFDDLELAPAQTGSAPHDSEVKNNEMKTETSEIHDDTQVEIKKLNTNMKEKNSGKRKRLRKSFTKETRKKLQVKTATVCDVCGKAVINMKEHKETHLPNKQLFKCKLCPKVFQGRSSRGHHFRVTHLGKKYYCTICKKFYVSGRDHNNITHTNRERNFECSYCHSKYFTKGTLKNHIRSHTKEKPHLCTVCGKGFSTHSEANYHKRSVHDKEKQHICQYCSKAFFYSHDLKEHIRVHTKEGVPCPQCSKIFVSKQRLWNHVKIHGKKEIICQICNKEFHARGNLNVHMISHTKEKKHTCKYCGVKFGRTDHRNRHEKTAHENKRDMKLEVKS